MTADQLAGLQTYATLLADYLPRRRWFPAKGREFSVVSVSGLPWFEHEGSEDGRRSRIELVGVAFSDGTTETYQVPVAYLEHSDASLEHALIGPLDHPELGHVVAYDAVFVKDTTSALLEGFRSAMKPGTADGAGVLEFRAVEGAQLPSEPLVGSVMSAEQSNTSIVYGDDAILKLFRR